ncbi:hypothetical protein LGH70_06470 [Hymenobacter sp. BT635]|uniref:T9SS C-terminal target domain-containing protein n=1 Tax=Hymenobacter nitidus TaxID=2880929 RepID=A0ABS8A9Z4_9BACT|nr:hypothetical protein [Hymenobacter nitidus]MCB2377218.1 hypothetical protein [Hymenobacter nitidus]
MVCLLGGQRLQASHVQAGELYYRHLSGNQYRVTLRLYRDCAGSALSAINPELVYRTSGCSGGATIPLTLVGSSVRAGDPYCAALGPQCGPGQRINMESGDFEATVPLPPGQWTLSAVSVARPAMGNVNNATGSLYCEATLDNRNGLGNTSATFISNSLVLPFLGWNLPTTLSQQATDPDGDSLAYELVAPLVGCNEPLTYKSFSSTIIVDPADPTCFTAVPTTPYSPTFPLLSFNVTGSCPLRQVQPYFRFNPLNGAISCQPALYNPGVNSPENKYAVAVKVSEYRRSTGSNGQPVITLVGTIRRELLLIVVDPGTNQNPTLRPVVINGSLTQPASAVIPARPGQLVSVRLTGTDANTNQILTMSSNAEQLLPNSEFTPAAPGFSPTVQIDWLPPATLAPGLYYCTVTTTDSNCPIKGVNTQTLTFRVSAPTLATQVARQVTALSAVPTPFQSQVSFTLARPGVQTVVVFDQLGRQVTTLQSQPTGQVQWRPAAGVPAGLYLARTADGRQVARLLRTE